MTPSTWSPFAQCLAAMAAAAALYAPQAAVSPPSTYQETIPGTIVRFDMTLVPGGAGLAPFYLGRTEVTWDMYDVFALGLDRKAPDDAPDAVARPSRPYGAPDYGWGHAGYPAISIAREGATASPVAQALPAQQVEQARKMLRAIHEAVRAGYYDPSFRGIDLDAHFSAAEAKLESARSSAHAMGIIAQTLVDFEDSHTYFEPPAGTADVDYGWAMRMVGDICYITSVDAGSDAEAKGLRPGDELMRVDQFTPARADLWKLRYLLYGLSPRRNVGLTVRSPGAEPRQVDVAAAVTTRPAVVRLHRSQIQGLAWRQARSARDASNQMSSAGRVAVWKLSGFDFEAGEVGPLFEKAVSGASALVLDMRGNGGGLTRTMEEVTGRLFDRDVTIGELQERTSSRTLRAKTRRGAFLGPVVALLDADSGSSAEMLGRVLQIERRGIVIGDRSAGKVMQARRLRAGVRTPRGTILYSASITTGALTMNDGASLEGVGVTPDELLLPAAEDLAEGRDPVLARAITKLGHPMDAAAAGRLFAADR